MIGEELDFRREASNIARIASNFAGESARPHADASCPSDRRGAC